MDEWCEKHSIRHKLIPIGEKELNGKVENTHKYDDEEFYSQYSLRTYSELVNQSFLHNFEWNEKRETKTLGWQTPQQVVDGYVFSFKLIELWFNSLQDELKENGLIPWVGLPVPVPTAKKTPKKPDPVDRYLAWMRWDESQYPKYAVMAVSGMSQIFSTGGSYYATSCHLKTGFFFDIAQSFKNRLMRI